MRPRLDNPCKATLSQRIYKRRKALVQAIYGPFAEFSFRHSKGALAIPSAQFSEDYYNLVYIHKVLCGPRAYNMSSFNGEAFLPHKRKGNAVLEEL